MMWKILAASSFAATIALAITVIPVISQQTGPAQVNGCIYHSAAITLTNLQSSAFLCDINGRLKVTTTP